MPDRDKTNNRILFTIVFLTIIFVCSIKPIAQDVNYHYFADNRTVCSLPNFWNVISNVPFLLIGLSGMIYYFRRIRSKEEDELRLNKMLFYFGIFLTGVGSSFYHFHPDNNSLVWDRLPMTIAFMSFLSIVVGKVICYKTGQRMLLPLILLGIISIVYWRMTSERGEEDLRFYVIIQFLPVLLITTILLLYRVDGSIKFYFWFILLSYVVAKLFELNDVLIYEKSNLLSGHSLKHFAAALGPLLFLRMEQKLRGKISK